jgi:hypothetical protein
VRAALAALPDTLISSVEIGGPPEGFSAPAEGSHSWFTFHVRSPDLAVAARGSWETMVVAGAYLAQETSLHLPSIAGRTVVIEHPDGTSEDGGSTIISPPADASAVADEPSASVGAALAATIRKGGGQIVDIELFRPYRVAAIVTLRSKDPADFVRTFDARISATFDALEKLSAPKVEGVFIQVEDPGGAVVAATGYSTRLVQGTGWILPDLHPRGL